MKVLVIDEDPNAQKILRALLQRNGCDPIVVTEEQSGLQHATGEAPPSIVICDWKTPGVNAPAFCKNLREAKPRFRPYVFILTTRHTKEEIAEGLDAGADDFIHKPFNLIEMQARLRVAMRTVSYQRDLQRQADETAATAERNKILGEMLSNQNSAKVPKVMQNAAAAVTSVKIATGTGAVHEFSQYEVRYIVSASLLEMRLALESTKDRLTPPNLKAEEFSAWAPVLLRSGQLWLDFTVSGSFADAGALFEKSLRRKPEGRSETLAFMAELVRMMSAGFIRSIQVREPDCVQPFPPKSIQLTLSGSLPPMIPKTRCHDLTIEGRCFRLIIATAPCNREQVELANLHELDILAEPLPPPSVSEVPLFKQGTVMTSRFVEKLHDEADLTRFDYKASIYRPSETARHFLNA